MKIRNARQWLEEECNVEVPNGSLEGKWFIDHNLPMVVSCTCCQGTMILLNSFITDEGQIYCASCAGED